MTPRGTVEYSRSPPLTFFCGVLIMKNVNPVSFSIAGISSMSVSETSRSFGIFLNDMSFPSSSSSGETTFTQHFLAKLSRTSTFPFVCLIISIISITIHMGSI